jgi:hypothetical protein
MSRRPPLLSPFDPLAELAAILATGILRLRKQHLLAGEPVQPPHETSPESSATRLEVPDKTVLSVHPGLTVPRVPRMRSTK